MMNGGHDYGKDDEGAVVRTFGKPLNLDEVPIPAPQRRGRGLGGLQRLLI
jgi:hypothetical protein